MTKKTYEALTPINHDRVDYAIGADIDLDDKHAAPLLAVSAIREREVVAKTGGVSNSNVVPLSTAKAKNADEPTAPEARQVEIVKAIAQLEKGNEAQWTKSGAPDVKALNALLGWSTPVTAAERDAVWAMLQEKQGA